MFLRPDVSKKDAIADITYSQKILILSVQRNSLKSLQVKLISRTTWFNRIHALAYYLDIVSG